MEPQFILTPYYLDQPVPELEALAKLDWFVNHQPLPEADVQLRMSTLHAAISSQVAAALIGNRLPVSVAGDCCTTLGVMAGLQREGIEPTLIWFDAHGDFNTWETTPSGFLGGMPLAMLAGLGEQTMVNALGMHPMAEERIILTDGRDLDPGEKKLIANSNVVHLNDPLQLLDHPLGKRPLYIHFDVDVVNPLDVAAVNYAAEGGPRATALASVFHHLAQTGQIAAVSLSTWNPTLDVDGRAEELCMKLLQVLLGESHSKIDA